MLAADYGSRQLLGKVATVQVKDDVTPNGPSTINRTPRPAWQSDAAFGRDSRVPFAGEYETGFENWITVKAVVAHDGQFVRASFAMANPVPAMAQREWSRAHLSADFCFLVNNRPTRLPYAENPSFNHLDGMQYGYTYARPVYLDFLATLSALGLEDPVGFFTDDETARRVLRAYQRSVRLNRAYLSPHATWISWLVGRGNLVPLGEGFGVVWPPGGPLQPW